MSMLAERRRKQIISVDPQNQHWIKDESKVASKLMSKMGWTNGSGLGANNQGVKDSIKLNPNSNQKGLGNHGRKEDVWLTQQDDFQDILDQLNKSSGNCTANKHTEQSTSSLESISKKSRARIHYHKFARGKDLSGQSAEAVAQVLGNRKKRKRDVEVQAETEASTSKSEDKSVSIITTLDDNNETAVQRPDNTTVSKLSAQEYFAEKMKRFKKKAAEAE